MSFVIIQMGFRRLEEPGNHKIGPDLQAHTQTHYHYHDLSSSGIPKND
jgi:hypothetical protein